ncbi:asparagine synthase C-terminal domain-containing protein [Piscinibacter sakaiensis]|uniref:asparagine synthase (glutamine-hydrolyzing) n=1 Tax=Piscinibacter sakaiensis TaxID=1547922 RepID=A0A0K8P7R4_PISS1|nr:asparagine synthase C-terminal domain-containing protein [Piscinibacter sakaiensis]GAP38657.1 hypothetical protein ISF6_5210 [Piscinibacter sakaiensis]
MFRYLAWAWDPTDDARSHLASQFEQRLQARPDWQCAHRQPGLSVHLLGRKAGTHEAYEFGPGRGVVVGKVFHRSVAARAGVLAAPVAAALAEGRVGPLLEHCWGRYVAFIAGRAPGDAVRVLRDPSGSLPCHLLTHAGVWLVCSWLEDALALLPPEAYPAPDRDGVGAFLLFGALSGARTAVTGVVQALPGEVLSLGRHALRRERVWSGAGIAASPLLLARGDAAALLRDTVECCVRQWSTAYDRIVLRLSGGIDSSILLSCLRAQDTEAEVLCLNYRSSDPGADERRYARLAARKAGRALREVTAREEIRIETLLELPRTPTPRSHVAAMSMTALDAEVAAEFGATAMFSGVGGDLVFFELHEWWPAADHLRLRGPGHGFAKALLDAAHLGGVSVWFALAMALRERWRPSRAALGRGHSHALLSKEVAAQAGAWSAFRHPAFVEDTGLPIGKLQQLQQLTYPVEYYEPLGFESAPEPVRPLLSQPVVELALRLPTFTLTEGGYGRSLARHAFADGLPPEIAHRRTKGTTGQSVKDILLRRLPFAREVLLDGELARLGLVDRDRVAQALSDRPGALATPYAEVNALISVEAWLRCWRDRLPTPAGPRR